MAERGPHRQRARTWRIIVTPLRPEEDPRETELLRRAAALDVRGLRGATFCDLYFLRGRGLDRPALRDLCAALLCDPLMARAEVQPLCIPAPAPRPGEHTVEITPRPGVTDTTAENLLRAARAWGLRRLTRAGTGRRVVLRGELDAAALRRLVRGALVNEVVQAWQLDAHMPPPFMTPAERGDRVDHVALRRAGDDDLMALSRERRLSLDLAEMRAIRAHFRALDRDPTDLELETLAQTWSEHCVHKTFRAIIDHSERDRDPTGAEVETSRERIDSLLHTFIQGPAEKLDRPWVRSAFDDNAGVIAFDDHLDLAFKVETHNHPSALEPFGGANTGVGGVIRDILGVSAEPIACTNALCFGPLELPHEALPEGVLHPRRVAEGVVAGIADYGNKMGIPTVNGAVLYAPGYVANPLVYCGCLGVVPRGAHPREPRPGDLVVCLGGRTGRDGLRGATFSSMEMGAQTCEEAGSSVQIGHPIAEKQVLEVVRRARDEGLYDAITDCGAGGLSSAVGEMAGVCGAEVHLERVRLKYGGLQPWEVWLSEAQERMVLAVPPERWSRLLELCAAHGVEATELGTFSGDGVLRIRHRGRLAGELDTGFLHGGIPRRHLRSTWLAPEDPGVVLPPPAGLAADLLGLLATPQVRSKEDVVRRYDHEVQGGTVVKPLVGPRGWGPGDATVLLPLPVRERDGEPSRRGVALAMGIQPELGRLDPYRMAWACVDEAIRNLVCVGADPDRVALLDNFCWGSPDRPEQLGALVRCAKGCRDASLAWGAPFISGKDSLNNEHRGAGGERHAIPGTLLVSAVGRVPDLRRTVTMDLKRPGDLLYVVGQTGREVGASAWLRMRGLAGGQVPGPRPRAIVHARALHAAMRAGLVAACHDCSEGGLLVAVAEMALAGELGAGLDLGAAPGAEAIGHAGVLAFAESLGRFVVEVAAGDRRAFEATMGGAPCARVGEVLALEEVRWAWGDDRERVGLEAIGRAFRGHVSSPELS